jgi:3',5'-cyclic AMP phosphodiesterase CpdA
VKTIVHLSDLHFGTVDESVRIGLEAAVRQAAPDLVVVSGDLTQRAKVREFVQARRFLDALTAPTLVVPGNHDVPLYDVFRRFLRPLTRYRRIVTDDLEPFYADSEIAVAGLNTARSATFKNGRINERQLARLAERFAALAPGTTRIVVVHHPFGHAATKDERDIVGRAALAVDAFSKSRIDIILAGHLHAAHVGASSERYDIEGYAALLIQAGTATSTRRRGEANSFNVIRIARPHVELDCRIWKDGEGFVGTVRERFEFAVGGWKKAPHLDGVRLQ